MDDNTKKLMTELIDAPFEFGRNDCFTFTDALVRSFHGRSYRNLHPKYKTEAQAVEYISRSGGIESLTTETLGEPIASADCKDGDVVCAEVAPEQIALGFVVNGYGLFKTKNRAIKIPIINCLRGWRIS